MALVVADRVQETTTTSGTGTLSLAGAVSGYQTFVSGVGSSNTTYYTIYDQSAQAWEIGIGTVTSGAPATLSRDTVLANSLGTTAKINLAGNVASVFCVYTAKKSVHLDAAGNATPLGTITSGTWQATPVGVAYGGTGVTTSTGANSVVLRDGNGNIVGVNNVEVGLTTTASAGGTTALTAASTQIQILTGSLNQSYTLPDATTLSNVGVFYTFSNASSGTLTIKDYAGTTLATIAQGGAAQALCINKSTVAGTWGVRVFASANTTWGNAALNYPGNITGANWQGTPIAYNYGGTGLTTFSAANNALYSTSATTLAAGTLPVAAGGTGATTTPTNGQLLIGNGTSYAVASLGTGTGISTTTGSGTLTINNTGVTSLAGTSPVTASASTGSVTVSLTSGYGDTQNPYASKTANYVLAAPNGVAGAPSFRALVAADIPALPYAPTAGSTSITTLGTIGTGTWQGSVINSTYGGTGVNNGGRTLTINTNSGTIGFTNVSTTLTVANTASVSGTNTGDQTITLTGDVTGSGTGSFATTLANSGVTAGTYTKVTTDAKGRVTAGTSLASADVTTALGYTPYNSTNPNGYITSSGSISGSAGSITNFTAATSANPSGVDSPTTLDVVGYCAQAGLPFSQSDGGLYTAGYSTAWYHQIFGDFRTGQIATRGKNSGTWQAWRIQLDSSNYNSYAPTLTGGGASGTWGINITGNAATASNGGVTSVNGQTGAVTVSAGITISDDTTTNATRYLTFTSATTGSISAENVSSTKLTFNPSTGTLTATAMSASSDETLKTNWRDVPDMIEAMAGVKHGEFDWLDGSGSDLGVSAQSLLKVLAAAVKTDGQGKLAVNYGAAALITCIQLCKRVVELEAKLEGRG